jgi:hypothetical protein
MMVCRDSDVRQVGIHTAEPLEFQPNAFEVEINSAKFKKCELSGVDQIQAGGETFLRFINS